jgi:nucleotide-binding universal stress UspA family protein
MSDSLKNILIPVDLALNTELAVRRGLELADQGTTIHLLHVQHHDMSGIDWSVGRYFAHSADSGTHGEIDEKLLHWKWTIEDSVKNIFVCTWIVYGEPVQRAIEKKAKQIAADLIIIGKSSHHSWFPFLNTVIPSQIVRNTGISTFTVKPGSLDNKIRSVIVPIAGEGPANKLNAITTICRKFRIKVHLVTFMNDRNDPLGFYPSHLLQAYQSLKSLGCTQVQYSVLPGGNIARSLVAYAERIGADVLLVHPESETKIGWMNKHISDVLPRDSRIQVLTVKPSASII